MTPEQRGILKQLVDAAVRARVRREAFFKLGYARFADCRACGGAHDEWTLGCVVCRERHRSKVRRGTHPRPEWAEKRLVEHTEWQRQYGLSRNGGGRKHSGGGKGKAPTLAGRITYTPKEMN